MFISIIFFMLPIYSFIYFIYSYYSPLIFNTIHHASQLWQLSIENFLFLGSYLEISYIHYQENSIFQVTKLLKATSKNSTFQEIELIAERTFTWLTSSMLLSLEIANAEALLFTRLIATLCFLPKSFYFFLIAQPAMLNQKKVEIFLAKFRKSLAKQFLEIARNQSRILY